MAITINPNAITNLEKDMKEYAKSLLEGTNISALAEAFGKEMKNAPTRNIKTITDEYIKIVTDDLVTQGMPKQSAKKMARAYVNEQASAIMSKIN